MSNYRIPTPGIEPKIRIYKIRVMPFNYAGSDHFNARENRTLITCVKGKSINRYTIASIKGIKIFSYAKGRIELPIPDHETSMLPLHYFALINQVSKLLLQVERLELSRSMNISS